MYCQKCGAEISDGSTFCGNCGTQVEVQNQQFVQQPMQPMYQQPYQQPYGQPYQQPYQQPYGQPYGQPYQQPYGQLYYQNTYPWVNAPVAMPMAWFKFLIYFSLFASGILNFIYGIQAITGMHYGDEETTKLAYSYFSGLKVVDIIYGIMVILAAILAIVARFSLAKYKKNGPKLLIGLYVLVLITETFYVVGYFMAVGTMFGSETIIGAYIRQVIISIIYIIINNSYFKKRAHLFVN